MHLSHTRSSNLIVFLTGILLLLNNPLKAQDISDLTFGTDTTLDVISWNIEWFPKNGAQTLNEVAEIIEALDVDLIAMQELDVESELEALKLLLNGWEIYYNASEYLTLAYLYRPESFENINIHTILSSYSRELPRRPLVFDAEYRGNRVVVINNHWKCCGDGYLDSNDEWDEETRRRDASILIDQYIQDYYPNEKVIVLGDFNDNLIDATQHNVFQNFLNSPSEYHFVDYAIASGSSSDWSYPSWPSHLDHILITNELFEAFEAPGGSVACLAIDDYYPGGWNYYDSYVSDHRPVGVRLVLPEQLSLTETAGRKMSIYPNPVVSGNTLHLESSVRLSSLRLIDLSGRSLLDQIPIQKREVAIPTDELAPGLYTIEAILENGERHFSKVQVLKP